MFVDYEWHTSQANVKVGGPARAHAPCRHHGRRRPQSFWPYTTSSMRWLERTSPDSTNPAYRIHGLDSSAGKLMRRARRSNSAKEMCRSFSCAKNFAVHDRHSGTQPKIFGVRAGRRGAQRRRWFCRLKYQDAPPKSFNTASKLLRALTKISGAQR